MGIGLVCAAPACVPTVQVNPLEVVRTRTPGVTYVIVHPVFDSARTRTNRQDGTGNAVAGNAEYVLLCDARSADRMTCSQPPEAANLRVSLEPPGNKSTTAVDLGVGVLADVSISSPPKDEPPPPPSPTPEEMAPAPEPSTAPPAEGGAK